MSIQKKLQWKLSRIISDPIHIFVPYINIYNSPQPSPPGSSDPSVQSHTPASGPDSPPQVTCSISPVDRYLRISTASSIGSWITVRCLIGSSRNIGSRASAIVWFSQVQQIVTWSYPAPQSSGSPSRNRWIRFVIITNCRSRRSRIISHHPESHQ